jgi:EAL domain-containing protein (putative c-di-GMP-specific phosphodiesterase class I)
MRWPKGDPESLTPSQFIRSAEDSGLILELGAWALEQACGVLSGWRRRGGRWERLRMSVNVSSVQLNDPEFGDRVAATLEAADLPPGALGLEFTETALMRGGSHALRQIEAIAATGVEILIDDFGTGYATLSYLKWARANTLKIDRSFIVGLGTDPVDLAIVRSQLALADELGMSSVAEGVESLEQFHELRGLGCRRFQGYLFGRAQPAPVIDEHFAKWPLSVSLLNHPIPDSPQQTTYAPEFTQFVDPAS